METFNQDPKPGRLVLPLVLIGMIATTYTFINRVTTNNNLEIVAEEAPVETVAEETPHLIFTEEIDPSLGLHSFQCRKIAFNLRLSGNAFKEMTKFVSSLYDAYDKTDSSLFEINPVLKTSDDKIMAVDSKVTLDNNVTE